ncbi:MAG: MFS transporter [Chromatiales bacterium]|nr:MFS transporter [Chromatiales bacterium]
MAFFSTLKQSLLLFKDNRLLAIFTLGFVSGLPWVLIGSAMTAWLKDAELSRSAIGFFGSIFTIYAFNFLWAPLVDRVHIPWLTRRLGQRRSWIVLMLLIMAVATFAIGWTDPGKSLLWTSLLAMVIATASATADIAIDAYRIDRIGKEDRELISYGAAMATSGWWTGYSIPGAIALYLSDWSFMNWSGVYMVLSLIVLLLVAVVVTLKEPESRREKIQGESEEQMLNQLGERTKLFKAIAWLEVTLIEPFAEFFRRNGWRIGLYIVTFIILFKVGEAFLGRMSIVFYKEVGFSNSDIATYSKLIGWWMTIIISLMSGVLASRLGIIRGLFIGGIAMAATNLMFAWLAAVGPDKTLFAAAIILDNITSSFATVTFVAFISYLAHEAYSASQYALMASLGNLGRTTLAASSGVMVDYLHGDWSTFFISTSVMVVPSLILLLLIGKHFVVAMERR